MHFNPLCASIVREVGIFIVRTYQSPAFDFYFWAPVKSCIAVIPSPHILWFYLALRVLCVPLWVDSDTVGAYSYNAVGSLGHLPLCGYTYRYINYHKISNIRRTKSLNLIDSRLVLQLPTGDAPTTSEWSTILLSTEVRLILETWWYILRSSSFDIYTSSPTSAQWFKIDSKPSATPTCW